MKYLNYKENRSRGTFDFPIAYYHVRPGHPRYEMSYHWHTEYEIMRVLEGSFDLSLNGQNYQLSAGDYFFIHDGDLHGGMPHDCIYECIVFDMQLLSRDRYSSFQYLQEIQGHKIKLNEYYPNPNAPYQTPAIGDVHALQQLHKTIWLLFEAFGKKNTGYELMVLAGLYEFFGLILQHEFYKRISDNSIHNHAHTLALKQALSIIETSYMDAISLEDLSKAAGMSPKYFCRFFYDMTKRTPIDYLNHYRIECACIRLVTTNESMTEVAFNCGFNDISYFIKTFKKYKGTTPKKYLSNRF